MLGPILVVTLKQVLWILAFEPSVVWHVNLSYDPFLTILLVLTGMYVSCFGVDSTGHLLLIIRLLHKFHFAQILLVDHNSPGSTTGQCVLIGSLLTFEFLRRTFEDGVLVLDFSVLLVHH